MSCLVLDAMGVVFRAADDVAELLLPFVAEHGGSETAVDAAYLEASLGRIEADEFWRRVGLDAGVEASYLARHALCPGITELLRDAAERDIPVWCLSNDVGRWSRHLRRELGIEACFSGATISSDVGLRKPDAAIYRAMLEAGGYAPGDLLFVDDRDNNVAVARSIGIESIRFDAARGFDEVHRWLAQAADPEARR